LLQRHDSEDAQQLFDVVNGNGECSFLRSLREVHPVSFRWDQLPPTSAQSVREADDADEVAALVISVDHHDEPVAAENEGLERTAAR
jgi:hypothetical protein